MSASSSFGRLALVLAETLLAVRQEALGQVREDREEDAVLEPVAQPLGVVPAALEDRHRASSPARPRPLGAEGFRAEEQPPVAEGFVGVGVARGRERLDQIDLVEVRGACMGLAAVEPPQPAVGDDDPVGDPVVEGRDDAGAGILFGRVGVVQVGPVQPAVPGVDEGGRQLACRRCSLRR